MSTSHFCDYCGALLADQTTTCTNCGQLQPYVQALAPLVSSPGNKGQITPSNLLQQRYHIIKQIGEGGFGVVYKARDRKRGRIVAIKQITLAALSAREIIDATDSYNREITLLPKLHQRNIPVIYDHFTDPEHWYIVMMCIRGQTLEEVLAQAKDHQLPLKEVLLIGEQLCNVLIYLHAQQPAVIFRDIKPDNIMITRLRRIYLIDFGIARRYVPEKKKDTTPLGSPGYAAPEQYGTAQSGPRTDLYGLGATLQTLLTGKAPNEGGDIALETELPDELKSLISSMLERLPHLRPGSAQDVKDVLIQVRKQMEKQIYTSFAWAGALWCLLFPILRNIFVPVSNWYVAPLILLGIYILLSAPSLHQARKTAPQGLTRKTVFDILNQRLSTARFFIYYMAFFPQLSFSSLHGSFSIFLLLTLLGLGGLFCFQILPALLIKEIKKHGSKSSTSSAVHNSPPQQTLR